MDNLMQDMKQTDDRREVTAQSVAQLQAAISVLPQYELPIEHFFADHVYLRVAFHPAGVAVVGYEHKTDHLFILATGELTIRSDEGMQRIRGPAVLHTKPGMKRAAFAHEDSVIMTVHVTDETDHRKIMDAILVPEAGSPLPSPGTDYLTHPLEKIS